MINVEICFFSEKIRLINFILMIIIKSVLIECKCLTLFYVKIKNKLFELNILISEYDIIYIVFDKMKKLFIFKKYQFVSI